MNGGDWDAKWFAEEERKKAAEEAATEPANRYATTDDLARMSRQVGEWMREVVQPLMDRIDELEAREFVGLVGPWREGQEYKRGSVVLSGGSSWIAEAPFPNAKPGVAESGWRLCAKRGGGGSAPASRTVTVK